MSRTGVTMTEFAVLLLLSEAPDRRMRMSALAAASGVTPPRVTRIIDGLSRHDLVRKERHGQDARGSEAVLTDAGLRAMHAAQPSHLASARRRVLDHIPADLLLRPSRRRSPNSPSSQRAGADSSRRSATVAAVVARPATAAAVDRSVTAP